MSIMEIKIIIKPRRCFMRAARLQIHTAILLRDARNDRVRAVGKTRSGLLAAYFLTSFTYKAFKVVSLSESQFWSRGPESPKHTWWLMHLALTLFFRISAANYLSGRWSHAGSIDDTNLAGTSSTSPLFRMVQVLTDLMLSSLFISWYKEIASGFLYSRRPQGIPGV